MRIFLLAPPMILPKSSIRRLTENLALLALGSYLQEKGHAVRCFDMPCEGYDNVSYFAEDGADMCVFGSSFADLSDAIDNFRPDVIGVSVVFGFQDNIALELGKQLKLRYPQILLICGGNGPTAKPAVYLANSLFDYVIIEEGEKRLEKFLDNISKNERAELGIDGIAFRKQCGDSAAADDVVIVPPEPLGKYFIDDFNQLPMMDRSLLNQEKYFAVGKPQNLFCMGNRVTTIFVGKGCPFNCTFCSYCQSSGRKLRYKTVDNVIKEIEYLKNTYGVDEIQFFCENLTIDKRWALELFERLIPYRLHWCTPTGLYFNSIDDGMLELMAKAGCYQITLAIENANLRVLKELMHKKVDLERVPAIVEKAHSLNMAVHGFFMVGMPGETCSEIDNTLKFPFEARFDSAAINVVNAIEPSELYDLCKEKGYLGKSESGFLSTTNIVIPEDSPDYAYSVKKLELLAKQTSQEHYEWSKKQFPQIWERKYKKYIQRNADDAQKLQYRL